MDPKGLAAARDFALKVKGSGYVVRRGSLIYSWGDPKKRYDLKSTPKSIGAHGARGRVDGWESEVR